MSKSHLKDRFRIHKIKHDCGEGSGGEDIILTQPCGGPRPYSFAGRVTVVLVSGPVTTGTESERERNKRHYQRALFDGIAERYEVSRPGYPAHVVEFVTATAGLGPGAAVLEVGCGTGQLTERLAC